MLPKCQCSTTPCAWAQVLHYWLSHTPNYDEVTAWYLGWKASFPPALIDHERVRRQFNAALDMMNTVRTGTSMLQSEYRGFHLQFQTTLPSYYTQKEQYAVLRPPYPLCTEFPFMYRRNGMRLSTPCPLLQMQIAGPL